MATRRAMYYKELAPLSLAFVFAATLARRPAQSDCPRGTLPAYAHNDYLNARPLIDALSLGYKGVEADVFLVNGKLQLGHERRAAAQDGTLEAVYLAPLRALLARCGTLTGDGQPFLLDLEIKESSRPTFDSLVAILSRYPELFSADSGQAADSYDGPPVQAVLVGWYPRGFDDGTFARLSRQARIESDRGPPADAAGRAVGLISIDYEETIGRRWQWPAHRRRWLSAIRSTKTLLPARRIRAYHVPVNQQVYRRLLDAGVDLIGTLELAETARLLRAIAPRLSSTHGPTRVSAAHAVGNR